MELVTIFISQLFSPYGVSHIFFVLAIYLGVPVVQLTFFGILSFFSKEKFITEEIASDLVTYWFRNVAIGMVIIHLFFTFVGQFFTFPFLGSLSQFSLIAQIFIFYFLVEFTYYVVHTLFHKVPLLWRFHSVHHEEYDLHWANSNKDGVFAITALLALVRLFMTMVSIDFAAVVIAIFIYEILAGLSHYGNSWTFGKWGYIFLSPKVHERHHELALRKRRGEDVKEGNFSGALSIFDHMFGTASWK